MEQGTSTGPEGPSSGGNAVESPARDEPFFGGAVASTPSVLVPVAKRGRVDETTTGARKRRLRLPLSRGLAVALALLLLFSGSRWDRVSIVSDVFYLLGCVLAGIGAIGRLWSSLYIAGYKSRSLATTGPYSISRNPLYLFSLIGTLGVGFATETLLIPLVFLVFFALYYPHIIRNEEMRLLDLFGDDFKRYRENTPAFFPKFSLLNEPESYAVNARVFRKHAVSAIWFIWAVGVLKFVDGMQHAGVLPVWFKVY